jgi:hypothetical protein
MAVDIYDATLDDVNRLVIWDVLSAEDPPPTMVEDWIQLGAAELGGLIGDITLEQPCGGEAFRLRARMIVALYAAAMAEDAHYPERTMDREAGDYGARLWARHKEQVASLALAVEACRDGISTGSAHGGIAHSFPTPPMFARDMGS